MVIFSVETTAILLVVVAVWFVMELLFIRGNVFKQAVDKFESLYMQKLQQAYTDDEENERSP